MTGTANTAEGDKILIVDDDPGLSSLLERFFTSKGYRARAVPNLSLIHISEPTRPRFGSRMPSSA